MGSNYFVEKYLKVRLMTRDFDDEAPDYCQCLYVNGASKDTTVHNMKHSECMKLFTSYREKALKTINKQLNIVSNVGNYDLKLASFKKHLKQVNSLHFCVIMKMTFKESIESWLHNESCGHVIDSITESLTDKFKSILDQHLLPSVTVSCYNVNVSHLAFKFLISKNDNSIWSGEEEQQLCQLTKDNIDLTSTVSEQLKNSVGVTPEAIIFDFPDLRMRRQIRLKLKIFFTNSLVHERMEKKFLKIKKKLESWSIIFGKEQTNNLELQVHNVHKPEMMQSHMNQGKSLVDPVKFLDVPVNAEQLLLFGRKINRSIALLIVDVQNDFISGSLALHRAPAHEDAEAVVPVINNILEKYKDELDLVIYTQDWHPSDHCSFIANVDKYPIHSCSKINADNVKVFDRVVYDGEPVCVQDIWPSHCIQGSQGAKFHKDLIVLEDSIILQKGQNPAIDAYSAFWDNARRSLSSLKSILETHNITTVLVAGIATDFCVGATSIHAAEFGFDTYMIENASRGIHPNEIRIRMEQMESKGVKIIQSYEIPRKNSPWLAFRVGTPTERNITEDTITIKELLDNFIVFKALEEELSRPNDESNWFKLGMELSKVVNFPKEYMVLLKNRERAGGRNPSEEFFLSMRTRFPELKMAEFFNKIRDCQRDDICQYLEREKAMLPELFIDLSCDHLDRLAAYLNAKPGPGWDILAANFGYKTPDIDYFRSASMQASYSYSPSSNLLIKLQQVGPNLKVRVLADAARLIYRNDIVTLLEKSIEELNSRREASMRFRFGTA